VTDAAIEWWGKAAIDFIRRAEQEGVRAAIVARDGPFRDYSQAAADGRPNPNHIIRI
jgi:enoyl-CoA hydratase